MIYTIKNKLLTIIFSLILGISVVAFTVSTIMIPTTINSGHDYTQISCEIRKIFKDAELTYVIYNNTPTKIEHLELQTRVFLHNEYCGSIDVSFDEGVSKKSDSSFTVNLPSTHYLYNILYKNDISALGFEVYLIYVSFFHSKQYNDLYYLIWSKRSDY